MKIKEISPDKIDKGYVAIKSNDAEKTMTELEVARLSLVAYRCKFFNLDKHRPEIYSKIEQSLRIALSRLDSRCPFVSYDELLTGLESNSKFDSIFRGTIGSQVKQ